MTDLEFLQIVATAIGLILALGVALAVLVSGLTRTKADALELNHAGTARLRSKAFSTLEFEDE